MRIINCRQQTEEWDRWRNRPTCSEFDQFITPAKGQFSASATKYAAKIVSKRLGTYTEPPPSFWMEWGTEHEPNAKHWYKKAFGVDVREVGFVLPDDTDAYGGSPDGLIGDDGVIEIKCPSPETLILYHANGVFPVEYRPQVQGLLLVTGRLWCDFVAWHPGLTPFVIRVEPDFSYMVSIADGLIRLLEEIERIEAIVHRENHELVSVGTSKTEVKFDGE